MSMGSIAVRKREIMRTYRSFRWLINEDIKEKKWGKLRDRLEAMEREMKMFAGEELTREFMEDVLSNLKVPKEDIS